MSGRELITLPVKDGWVLDRIRGSHHVMIKGGKTLTVPVHGKRDLPKGTLSALMKHGGLK
jgi:predicted RNA binding protein YcfA (HicA-like mRNA interferase family)